MCLERADVFPAFSACDDRQQDGLCHCLPSWIYMYICINKSVDIYSRYIVNWGVRVCIHIFYIYFSLLFQVFQEWNKTELDSFLIEITANILKFKDSDGKYLLPKIKDSAGQKGTGKWTAISALEYGVPVTLIGNWFFDLALSFLPAYTTSQERAW